MDMDSLITWHKALADPTRLRLCLALGDRELAVAELVRLLDASQPKVSRHLKVLADAGVLRCRRDGLWAFYSLDPKHPGRSLLDAQVKLLREDSAFKRDKDLAARILVERVEHTRRFFNRIAPDWSSLCREVLGDFDLAAALESRLPERGNCSAAADLGCGSGELLPLLAGHCERVLGVDNSQAMLEEARRRYGGLPGLSLRLGDLEHLPMADAEVDACVLSLVLHHLSEPLACLREAQRVLSPGGLLCVAELGKHDDESLRERQGDRFLGFAREELEAWLRQAGLAPVSFETRELARGHSLHIITATKPDGGMK